MKCVRVLAWLLGSAALEPLPTKVAQHLQHCSRCQQHWRRLWRLESVLAAGPTANDSPRLESFLRQHGFVPVGEPARPSVNEPAPFEPRGLESCQGRRFRQGLHWWLILTIALVCIPTGVFMVWRWTVSGNSAGDEVALGSVTSTEISSGAFRPSHESARLSGTSAIQDSTPLPRKPDVSGTYTQSEVTEAKPRTALPAGLPTFSETSPTPVSPFDTETLLARARADTQGLWLALDSALPLVRDTENKKRLGHVSRLTALLGEEIMRQVEIEVSDLMSRQTEQFERGVKLLLWLCQGVPDSEGIARLREEADRFSALAERARRRMANRPMVMAEKLDHFATCAEQAAAALRKLAIDGRNRSQGAESRTPVISPAHTVGDSLLSNKPTDDFSQLRANAEQWWSVVFIAESGSEELAPENPSAHLLMSSIRWELWDLTLACALRLAEVNDPLLRLHLTMDLAEGLLRGLAVVCGAGPSSVSIRLARYLNRLLQDTLQANWPASERCAQAEIGPRRQGWNQGLQRLADLLAILQLDDAELPTAVRAAWSAALTELDEGIAAIEAAFERGAPQLVVLSKPENNPPPPTAPNQTVVAPAKPMGKPNQEMPRKPDKLKPPKLPFKPNKPFPDRFKDLKDLWEGKKH
ncbi:MAG: hypothetical protein RMJ19_04555 [Gemmatales bacterium]|nr:hypothetical protein [Gemmatales bacterium]MDW8174920.1 hypothetical protein [Gemmatales bacterium]